MESRQCSGTGRDVGSCCRTVECLRAIPFGGVVWLFAARGGGREIPIGWADRGLDGIWLYCGDAPFVKLSTGDTPVTALLVDGREDGGGIRALSCSIASFLRLNPGGGISRTSGSRVWPRTRPAAAAATAVPVPTSWIKGNVSKLTEEKKARKTNANPFEWPRLRRMHGWDEGSQERKKETRKKKKGIDRRSGCWMWFVAPLSKGGAPVAVFPPSCLDSCARSVLFEWDCFLRELTLGTACIVAAGSDQQPAKVNGRKDIRESFVLESRDSHRHDIARD